MKKVKFGIIGTGMIAGMHADAMKQLPKCELTAVYDKVPERAAAFAERYGCAAVPTLEAFLASGIDAVTIGTPSGLHGEVAIASANAGKHILCEKPLEVTVAKIDEVLAACHRNHVILSAVFQSRFSRSVELIKKAIDTGRFGTPVLSSASIRWYRTPEYYAGAGWRGTWALDGGGALMNQGIHTADLLLYFNGPVAEINGQMANRLHHSIEVEDTVVGCLKFKNGALGVLEASTACAPGLPRRVEFSGTKGSVVLEDDRILRWEFSEAMAEDEEIRRTGFAGEGMQGGSSDPKAISCEGHRRQLAELSDAILNGKAVSTPGEEGRRTVEMICAIYEAAKNGKTVYL